jgi:hypothetical protein
MDSSQTIDCLNGQLYALTWELTIADGRRVNIHTDLFYAFATLHIHGAIYKERGLLMSGGKEIKNSKKNLATVIGSLKAQAITAIYCPTHANQPDKINQGNGLLDRRSKEVTLLKEVQTEDAISAKICFTLSVLLDHSEYSPQEENRHIKQGLKKTQKAGSSPQRE